MKPHLKFRRGWWHIGPRIEDEADYFLWACCAPTVRRACELWRGRL